jgi:methyl-accepting chemotaxis protein
MALVKKVAAETDAPSIGKPSLVTAREAEAQRKKARTLAKQQQAAERIAAATGQLASGIAEASSAAEELKRASDQIASGAEEASSAAQESLAAFQQVGVSINRQLLNADVSRGKGEVCQTLIARTSGDVAGLITNVGVAAQRQMASVGMVQELEKQAANIGDIVKAVAHRRPDQFAGLERGHRGRPSRQAWQGLRGGGRRGAHAGRDLGEKRQADPGTGGADPGGCEEDRRRHQ